MRLRFVTEDDGLTGADVRILNDWAVAADAALSAGKED